jgi:hypothetical protein
MHSYLSINSFCHAGSPIKPGTGSKSGIQKFMDTGLPWIPARASLGRDDKMLGSWKAAIRNPKPDFWLQSPDACLLPPVS